MGRTRVRHVGADDFPPLPELDPGSSDRRGQQNQCGSFVFDRAGGQPKIIPESVPECSPRPKLSTLKDF
jgi:hypothetical protein